MLLSIPPSLFYLIKILLEAILVRFVLKWRETRTRTQTSIHFSLLFLLLKNYFQALDQMIFSSPGPDDIFLTVQRSTFAMGKIYNDLFANSRSDFISELSELCCVAELRYVRDMVFSIVKRKLGLSNLGSLIERRSGANVKDNLLKDIYNLYSLEEKSIDALPKNMIRSDTRFCIQEVQTDTCLSNTLFATKSDVEELKNDFLSKLSDLREEFTSVKCPLAPVVSSPSESDDDSTQFPWSQVSPSSTLTQTPTSSQNKNVSASGQVHVIVMGDFYGNLGNSLGDRGHYAPNDRGVKLLDFANYFNLCPTNLLSTCRGPLETFVSHCGLFKSTIDYIFLPVYLIVLFPVKFLNRLLTIHQTISLLNLKLTTRLIPVLLCLLTSVLTQELRDKIRWSKFTMENILTSYASPIAEE